MPFSLHMLWLPNLWLWKASPFFGPRSFPCNPPLRSIFFLLMQFHGHAVFEASCFLDYPPLLQIGPRRKYIINWSDHEYQTEGRHSPHVFPSDRSLEVSSIGHWPCWLCCTARVILSVSICLLLSWIIMAALAGALAVDHLSKWFHPTPWQSTWMGPLISSKAKIASDFSISSCALNFHPEQSCGITLQTVVFDVVERPLHKPVMHSFIEKCITNPLKYSWSTSITTLRTWWAASVFQRSCWGTDLKALSRSSQMTCKLSWSFCVLNRLPYHGGMLYTTRHSWDSSFLVWNVNVPVRCHEISEPCSQTREIGFSFHIWQWDWSKLIQTLGFLFLGDAYALS